MALLLLGVLVPSPGNSSTTFEACAAVKLVTAGKRASDELYCHRRAAFSGSPVDPSCLERAHSRFTAKFATAEATGDCPGLGNGLAIETRVGQFTADVAQALRPAMDANGCASVKLRAVARDAYGELRCHRKAALTGIPVDPLCLQREETRLMMAFAGAEAAPPCFTAGDLGLVAAKVDVLVAELVTALPSVRPNIVLVLTDDQRWDTLPWMPVVTDELVGHGVTFTQAVTPTALCEPSRATILTGLLASHHGVRNVVPPLGGAPAFVGPDQDALPVWLHGVGYRTGFFGKYMNSYLQQGPPSSPSWYIPPGWDRWRAFVSPDYYDYSLVHENGMVVTYANTIADYSTDVLRSEALAFLRSVPTAQPVFLEVAPFGPHLTLPQWAPLPAPRHVGALNGLSPYRPPNYNEEDVSDKPAAIRNLPPIDSVIAAFIDGHRQAQLESLLAVDELVGALLDAFRARNQLDRTVFVFMSDNGYDWGEHRRYIKKACPYEECIRIPLVLRTPGIAPRTEGALVSNLDVAPTLAALANVRVPSGLDGVDLGPLIRQEAGAAGHASIPLENWTTQLFNGTRTPTQTTGTHLATGEREQYDLLSDPYQLTNEAH